VNSPASDTHNATGSEIDLSVVVVTLVDAIHLANCLAALSQQSTTARFEVIVPADSTLGDISDLKQKYSGMKFIDLDGRHTYAELRATGANNAGGRLLAVTEDHCLPDPDWVDNIVSEHAGPHLAIGGTVEKNAPDKALNWAVYFLDYLRYSPPAEGHETHELTDLNVSYKMDALQKIAGVWQKEFHEPNVHAALGEMGGSLWLSPNVRVHQRRNLTLGHALWDRYAFGRLFGSTRVAGTGMGKRLVYAAMSPALPALLVVRLFGHIRRKGIHKKEFFRALPAIILLGAAWAWGEMIGYLTGSSVPELQPQSA
jgi:hypothetical protein